MIVLCPPRPFLLAAHISAPAANAGPSRRGGGPGGKSKCCTTSPTCSRVWEWAMSISAGRKIRNLGELCHLDNKSLGVLEGSFFIGKHWWKEYFAAYLFIAHQCFFALRFLEKAGCLNGLKGGRCERTKPPLQSQRLHKGFLLLSGKISVFPVHSPPSLHHPARLPRLYLKACLPSFEEVVSSKKSIVNIVFK